VSAEDTTAGNDEAYRPSTLVDRIRDRWFPHASYHLARFAILRLLGVVYAFAFLGLVYQAIPLFGEHGLTPAAVYVERVQATGMTFADLPSLFWWGVSDTALRAYSIAGLALSIIVVAGFANAPILFVLWVIYGSFVRIGQVWYGYGWEIQLVETGFLAVFLTEPIDPRPFPKSPPPFAVVVLLRWLVFRIFLGAGLIKLRGDPCWVEATCLDFHFETQPVPNPSSPYFHFAPHAVHVAGVWLNHAAELVAPFFVFGPRAARRVAGAVMIAFQIVLVLSGNLAFLNWLTIVPVIACFDDELLVRLLPSRVRARWRERDFSALASSPRRIACGVLMALVAILSIDPVLNLLSDRQSMNRSYTSLELVNTYGAFGSIGQVRDELVIEGTNDDAANPSARWRAYELPCKPGDLRRRPCVLGPYHYRLDWQLWFAAMGSPASEPWSVELVARLLRNDRSTLSLFANDPFPRAPPRFIRIRRFAYRFAPIGADAVWHRQLIEEWLPPLERDDPRMLEFLRRNGLEWRF